MREIKFRAWDRFNACYWYSDNYANLAVFFTAMQGFIDGDNELIFEEYTGLKDKNGKGIFEGDIVARKSKVHPFVEIYWADFHYTTEWRIRCGSFNRPFMYLNLKKTEVVGNIYEKHELLEDK